MLVPSFSHFFFFSKVKAMSSSPASLMKLYCPLFLLYLMAADICNGSLPNINNTVFVCMRVSEAVFLDIIMAVSRHDLSIQGWD